MNLSIIIPTYPPHHQFLPIAIRSIDYPCEIVVVNDSRHVPLEDNVPLEDIPNIKIVNRQTDVKWDTGIARNIGADVATGDVLLWLDSDDKFLPNAIGHMVMVYEHMLSKVGYAHVVYGGCIRHDTRQVYIPKMPYMGYDINKCPLRKGNMTYAIMIPKAYHEYIGGFVDSKTWEDLIYEMDLYVNAIPTIRIPIPIYEYRWSNSGRRAIGENLNKLGQKSPTRKFLYNRYVDYYTQNKTLPNGDIIMACSRCGKKKTVQPIKLTRESLPPIDDDEILYLQYISANPSLRIVGGVTGITYSFDRTHNFKEVVLKVTDNRTQVDRRDAELMLKLKHQQGRYDVFRPYVEVKLAIATPELQPTRIPNTTLDIQSYVVDTASENVELTVSSYSVTEMSELAKQQDTTLLQLQTFLAQEKRASRPRKTMVQLLETTIAEWTNDTISNNEPN